jgi:hypothetical protein
MAQSAHSSLPKAQPPACDVASVRHESKPPVLNANDRDFSRRSAKRGQLLIECTREFSQIKRPEQSDIQQFKELFYQFVGQLSVPDRRLVSAMLARQNFTPRPVALYFAHDLLEIAAPFLLFSPVLGDRDLQVIAEKKGPAFAAVIKRRSLPMEPFTASKLNEQPAEKAKADLVATYEKPSDIRSGPTLGTSDQQSPTNLLSGDEILALASVGGRLGRKERNSGRREIRESIDRSFLFDKPRGRFDGLPKQETSKLLMLARNRDHGGVANMVEDLCGLQSQATLRLIKTTESFEILYLIKALGVSSPKDMQLALLLLPTIGRSFTQYREAKKLIGDIDCGICRMIFNEIGAKFPLGEEVARVSGDIVGEGGFHSAARRRREDIRETDRTRLAEQAAKMAV